MKEEYNEMTLFTSHICGEGFDKTLQEFISESDIDIFVMVTYQRDFLERIFNPSNTKRMSYHTNVPLLAIPVIKN